MPDDPKSNDVVPPNEEASATPDIQSDLQQNNQADMPPELQSVEKYEAEPSTVPAAVPALPVAESEPESEPVQPKSEPLPQPSAVPASSDPVVASAPVTPAPKKKRKGLIMAAVAAGALVLLTGTSVAAYSLWYQNPEKVVSDALVHAITAQTVNATGTATVVGEAGYTLKIEVSGRNDSDANATMAVKLTVSSDDANFSVDGEGIFSKEGDIYLKVNEVQKLLTDLEKQSDGQISYEAFGTVVKKIDGNWIKISKDDLGDVSEEYSKTQKCLAEISKSLESDSSFRKDSTTEIEKLYKENNFITIGDELKSRTINGQDSIGYPISADRTKADAFFTGFASTELGKRMAECDKSIKFSDFADGYNKDETTTPQVELWASRIGHELTELNWKMTDDEASGTIVINPVFNKNEAVTVPAESVPFSEVVKDFEAAFSDLYAPYDENEGMKSMDDASAVNYN